jgi:Ca-activated chloride channel family protein
MSNIFANPWFLLLLPVAPLLAWWWASRRRRPLPFASIHLLSALPGASAKWTHRAGALLRFLALSTLILALAGPRWPDQGTRIPAEGIAVALVVDVSGSMAEQDFQWNRERISRMEAAKRACRQFVKGDREETGEGMPGRANDQICLVTFATRPESSCPLTLSHSVLLDLLDAEEPRRVPTESQTNIGDAIAWAIYKLEAAGQSRKVILLLSDGEHNVPSAMKPRQAAHIAAAFRIPIHVIDVGGRLSSLEANELTLVTPSGNATNDPSDALEKNKQVLRAVAALTGGRYFRADDLVTLSAVCQEIDRLEKVEIKSFHYRRFYDAYRWFAVLSLVFFAGVYFFELSICLRIQ